MAAIIVQCFSATFAILLVILVFVDVTSAQITFNRHWRRGNYPGENKADDEGSGEVTFNVATKSEHSPSAVARFNNNPTSIILTGNILGKIWRGSKNFPSASKSSYNHTQPRIQQVSIH